MNIMRSTKSNNVKTCVITIIVVVIAILPFLLTIPLTTLSADDFSMALKDYSIGNCFARAFDFYYSWGGGIPFIFLEYLLNPLQFGASYSYAPGIELLIFFGFFVLLLWFFVRSIFKYILRFESRQIVHIVFLLLLITLLNSELYPEIFYWYVGGFSMLSKIFVFFFIICIFWLFTTEKSIIACIVTSLLGFITCFEYIMAATLGIVYLLVWYISMKRRKIRKGIVYFIPLIFMILGGCLAAFAPGNFSRHHGVDATGIQFRDIINALDMALRNTVKSTRLLFTIPIFILAILMSFLLGVYVIKRKYKLHPIVLLCCGFLSVYCLLFPIALGYAARGLPNRHVFNANFLIITWGIFVSLYTGNYYSEAIKKRNYIVWAAALIAIVLIVIQPLENLKNLPWIKTVCQVSEIRDESNYIKDVLKEIETSDQKNIVVHRKEAEHPQETGVIREIGVSSNPDNWINQAMSSWFDKETIVYEVIP